MKFLKVLIKEVVDFFVVFVSVYDDVTVYDDACFTLISFGYHCIFLFKFAIYVFLDISLSFGHYVVVIVGRADLFHFLGCQGPKWSLHLTVQHSYSLFCFHY